MARIRVGSVTVDLDDSVGAEIAKQARGDKQVARNLIAQLITEIRDSIIEDTQQAMEKDD